MSRSHAPVTDQPNSDVASAGLTLQQRIAVLGTVLLTAIGLLVALQSGSARAASHSVLDLQDTFRRTVHSGFGSAQRGGSWAVGANSRHAHFSVADDRGTVGPLPGGRSATASLRSVRVANQRMRVAFKLPHQARRGGGTQISLNLRHVAGGSAYRATVRVRPNGKMTVWLMRYHNGRGHQIGKSHTFRAPLHHRAVVLEAAVTGHFTVGFRARAYLRGNHVPNWQVRYADTTSARVVAAGSVGVTIYNTQHTAPAVVTVNSLLGWITPPRTPAGPPDPSTSAPPTDPAPSTTDSSTSSAPSTSSSAPSTSSSAPSTSSSAPSSSSSAPSTSSSAPSSTSSAPTTSSSSTTTPPPPPPPAPDRGSLAVGDAEYAVPAGALFVSSASGSDSNPGTQSQPLRTVAAAVRAASTGQTIVLRAGTYHENVFVTDVKRVTIQNYPDEAVWFDGSSAVTNWTRQGSTWVSTGWNAQFDHSASFTTGSDAGGFVNSNYPMAAWPDQMFVDGDPIAQVASNPGAGQFAVDYNAHTLTMGSDPTGHSVRASDLAQAFVVAGNVTLRGFGVRRYATSLPQIGTIFFGGTHGGSDVVQNVVIYDNATQGLGIGVPNCVIDHVTTNRNGMVGMMANTADNLTIKNSVLDRNNTEHFNSSPSAGGMKIGRTNGVIIRNNEVEDNYGIDGIWTDITTSNFQIVGNTVSGNNGPYGIITELSDSGIVADNVVSDNRYGYTAFDTGNVKVYNNTFSNNTVWDIGASQDERRNQEATKASVPWLVRNVTVSNNLYGSAGAFQFYALDKATHIPASSMNITVDGNAFPSNTHAVMVGWGGADNSTVTYYRSPSALDSGLHVSWTNVLVDSSSDLKSFANNSADDVAVPLPADVATAIGVPTGTKHIGTF